MDDTKGQQASQSQLLGNLLLLFINKNTFNLNRLDFKEQIGSLIWLSTMKKHSFFFSLGTLTAYLMQVTMWRNIMGYLFGILI